MPATRLIVLEFNELTPSLLEEFISIGALPNFGRFYRESAVYTTDAGEEGRQLNPWVQWVTAHTGLSSEEHRVYHLDEGHELEQPRVWEILSDLGKRVWVCGSMNTRCAESLNGWVLPDPWAVSSDPYPSDVGLDAYYRFVSTQVQEHTNETIPLGKWDYVRFVRFMMWHGLSLQTITSIVMQFAREWLSGNGKWKRAVILDKLQFDLFQSVFRESNPDFSTFFVNSVAHFQHTFWRHMDPAPFKHQPSEGEREEFQDAILYGYRAMDTLLGRFMDLAGDNVTLVFTTALSQQPCVIYEETGGKKFYRARDLEAAVRFAGVTSWVELAPVMSEQFRVRFADPAQAEAASALLDAVSVNGHPLLAAGREDETSVFSGVQIFDDIPEDATLRNGAGERRPFSELFYQADGMKSGMHHPDGALWIRGTDGRRHHRVYEEKVALRALAPTLLRMFGVDPPPYMTAAPLDLEH